MSFSLSRKADYALVALAALAEHHSESGGERAGDGSGGIEGGKGTGSGTVQPLSARAIAERYDLPLALLMNILKDLHRGGVLESRRGPTGGYLLTRRADQISMLTVVEAVEGQVKVALCCEDEAEGHGGVGGAESECIACRVLDKCPVKPPMQQFNEMVRAFLGSIHLSDLLTEQTHLTLDSLTRTLAGSSTS